MHNEPARTKLLAKIMVELRALVDEYGPAHNSRSVRWSSGTTSNPKTFSVNGRKTTDDLDDWLCLSLDAAERWMVHREGSRVILTDPFGERHYLAMARKDKRKPRRHPLEAMLNDVFKGGGR